MFPPTTWIKLRSAFPLAACTVLCACGLVMDSSFDTLREALRLRPEVLRRFGWHTMRVHAFELFTDPEGVADRIAELVGADASRS